MRDVLIVDDDETVRALLQTVASRCDGTVDTASDGEEALALLRKKQYELVILDLMLPKVNGFQVAAVVHKMTPRPQLVVFSGLARYFEDRFWDGVKVLQKPFAIPEVEAVFLQQ